MRVFDILTQKVRPMALQVMGKETVQVAAGSYETYRVQLDPLDGEPGGSVFNVSVNEPRCVVSSESKLPASMGGGSMKQELQSIRALTMKE